MNEGSTATVLVLTMPDGKRYCRSARMDIDRIDDIAIRLVTEDMLRSAINSLNDWTAPNGYKEASVIRDIALKGESE